MPDAHLPFAKIVATPTPTSWSQVYNAGRLFAVLALSTQEIEETPLATAGKDIFAILEQEYFSLETKELESIKQAVLTASEKIPNSYKPSFLVAAIIKNVLYLFISGEGKVILKRDQTTGLLLKTTTQTDGLVSASGFLQTGDMLVLETAQFAQVVQFATLKESLLQQTPAEVAETLSPKIHEKEEGGASAIVIAYMDSQQDFAEDDTNQEEEQTLIEEKSAYTPLALPPLFKIIIARIRPYVAKIRTLLHVPVLHVPLNHTRRVFLTLIVLLVCIFAASMYFSIKRAEQTKTREQFQKIFEPAQQKYDEGQALISLNKNLANEDFKQSQKMLVDGEQKFKKGSKELQQIQELRAKVEDALAQSASAFTAHATAVDMSNSVMLSALAQEKTTSFVTTNGTTIFLATQDGVSTLDKNGNKKQIIPASGNWSDLAGIGVFLGNVYVVDKKNSKILKFSNADKNAKSDYFSSGNTPDLSKTASIAIDSSIWVLFTDGVVQKYTRGKSDNFTVSGLDKPFTNPTRIYTTADLDNVFILDNGNSRIVVLNKNGAYQAQYQAGILKSAKDFEVKDKKTFILSENKLWQIDSK